MKTYFAIVKLEARTYIEAAVNFETPKMRLGSASSWVKSCHRLCFPVPISASVCDLRLTRFKFVITGAPEVYVPHSAPSRSHV